MAYNKKRFNWRNLLLIFLTIPLLASSFAFLNTSDAFAAITDAECENLIKSGAGTKTKDNCHVRSMPKAKCEGYGGKSTSGSIVGSSCDIPIDNKSGGGDGGDKGTPSDPKTKPEDFTCKDGTVLEYNTVKKEWACAKKVDLKKNECKSSKGKEYFWADKKAAGGDCYEVVGEPEKVEDKEEEGEESKCRIEALGWLLCPVLDLMGNITDGAYAVVSELLSVQPILTTGDSEPIYNAWKSVRNVANVAFVIAFLIIIFSQVTSIGFSNYNIKKMVPRLVMAAVLVNVSYWVCALAVDLSNIIGFSIKSIFDGMASGLKPAEASYWNSDANGPSWVGITAAVLIATGTALYIGLSAFIPIIIAAFIAILTVFIVLTARQALIILLIVISPLAFVAMLLPNTENWFTRWRQLLQILLLMFPIIGGIFGASALASVVIMNGASGDYKWAIQIMGAGVAIVPLALTPIVMKTAGGILGKIGAFVNNPNRGPLDALRKKGEEYRGYRKNIMRANRLNPTEGSNKVSRAWRRTAGKTTRMGADWKAKGERATAAAEAAEAGYLMSNKDKAAAANLRSATAGANSAAAAEAIKSFSAENARAALGQTESDSTSLAAALRTQEKAGEDQMIKEFQNIHGPKDANTLKSSLINAITKNNGKGDVYEAQAIENLLDGMGNKGASVMADVIAETDGKMTGEMRTELSRNLGAGTMGRHEALKDWATSTAPQYNTDGTLKKADFTDTEGKVHNDDIEVTGKSFEEAKAGVMGRELKLDKVKAQESKLQSEYIHNGKMSIETMQQAVQPQHSGSFEPKDIEYMKKQIANAAASGVASATKSGPAPSSNPGTLTVEHTYTNPPSASPSNTSTPSTPAFKAETIAERNARIRNSNRDMTGN